MILVVRLPRVHLMFATVVGNTRVELLVVWIAGVNEFTPMAGLVDVGQRLVYCGATIISNRYVITAAHCVEAAGTKDLNNVGILVGDHDVSTGGDTPAAALYRIQSYDIHPQYESKTYQNDLAILRTTGAMNFSIYVGPACLPFRYSTFDFQGVTVTALGWGLKEFSGPTSDILQKVNLTVEPSNECMTQYPDRVTANQICTYAPGKDSCQSDSGGPLFWFDPSSRRLQILGVISFGLGCATEKPSVNTRVTSYLSWIVSKTTDATYCIK
ncbi:hypothetical protein NQ318_018925 [Aromia moschata]|uniref:Peptidase S1 domain-containing protein n=1 Tax=Aromia moschata TaxID=1265417 RepID=A0AAV8ZHL6_9CUCU|nr:hypothetical protein NQ318_018925 [Aromia moschata]